MDYSSAAGPVQIVSITDDHKFVLDEKKLKEILYHKRAQGRKVDSNIFLFKNDGLIYLRSPLFQLREIFEKENHLSSIFFFDIFEQR